VGFTTLPVALRGSASTTITDVGFLYDASRSRHQAMIASSVGGDAASGFQGMKGRSAYSASKAGMNAFAQSLAAEVARDGINVHVVAPAPVDTPMLDRVTFPMHVLRSRDVADVVAFLDRLDPSVVLPEVVLRAASEGPLASEPIMPEAAALKAGRAAERSGPS